MKPQTNYSLMTISMLLAVGCTSAPPPRPPAFDAIAEEFVYGTLATAAALAVNADQKRELEALVRNGNSSQRVALRSRLLLLAHQGV
ncbi:MAG: hypothetical protein ABIZ80_02490, partial [Bryobacteraceae bacterium]